MTGALGPLVALLGVISDKQQSQIKVSYEIKYISCPFSSFFRVLIICIQFKFSVQRYFYYFFFENKQKKQRLREISRTIGCQEN